MSDTLFTRIGNIFRRKHASGELPIVSDTTQHSIETRSTFLRPWARRDQAIENLQNGFNTLTDLMAGIKENLESSAERQNQILEYLAHFPKAVNASSESQKVHGETLKAIHMQLASSNIQQEKLSEILDRLSETSAESRHTVDELRDRMEHMRATDAVIAENLNSVGSAMQAVSQHSSTSTQVLTQLRDQLDSRDGQLEQALYRQGTRFTALLSVAIFISMAALISVLIIGFKLLGK